MYIPPTFPLPITPICYSACHGPTLKSLSPTMTVKKLRTWHTLSGNLQDSRRTIKFTLWANKEFSTPGHEITMHFKDMKSWNSALNYLTAVLNPRFGAVRKLYNLETRQQVQSLKDIQHHGKYIAVGSDKFKFIQNGYLTENEMLVKDKLRAKSANRSDADVVAQHTVDFMDYTKKYKRTVIYVMVSNRPSQVPIKVVLIESDLVDYNMVLDYLAYRLDIGEGIKYVANDKGKIILSALRLQHGGLYVAVPFGTNFVKMDYKELCAQMLPDKKGQFKSSTIKKKKKKRKELLPKDMEHDLNAASRELESSSEIESVKSEPPVIALDHDDTCICSPCTHATCEKGTVPDKQENEENQESLDKKSSTKDIQVNNMEFDYPPDFEDYIINKETHKPMETQGTQVELVLDECRGGPMMGDLLHDDLTKESTSNITEDMKVLHPYDEQAHAKIEPSKILTTFADIARERELEKELQNEELDREEEPEPEAGRSPLNSMCSVGKKSVTFPKSKFPIFLEKKTSSEVSNLTINRIRIPKTSILKVKDGSHANIPSHLIPPVPVRKQSFASVRDSIQDDVMLRRVSQILRDKLLEDKENGSDDSQITTLTTGFPIKKTPSDPNLIKMLPEKGVQKYWRTEDEVEDKKIQVEEEEFSSTDSSDDVMADMIFENAAADDKSVVGRISLTQKQEHLKREESENDKDSINDEPVDD